MLVLLINKNCIERKFEEEGWCLQKNNDSLLQPITTINLNICVLSFSRSIFDEIMEILDFHTTLSPEQICTTFLFAVTVN